MMHQMGSWEEGWPVSGNRVSQYLTDLLKRICVNLVCIYQHVEDCLVKFRVIEKYKVSFSCLFLSWVRRNIPCREK